ncbi:MAG TPA: hypothetical protein VMV76_02200 [Dehalococcoidia bacterium]|nr:hypothetical protein [Dehalococcoidia bacterium]
MEYLNLAASIGLAMGVLGLNLMILSRALVISIDRLPMFGRKLKKLCYVLLAIGVALTALGIFVFDHITSFISVGSVLILSGVAWIAQGEALLSPESALTKLGQRIRIYAWLYAVIGVIAVVVVFAVSLCLSLCSP